MNSAEPGKDRRAARLRSPVRLKPIPGMPPSFVLSDDALLPITGGIVDSVPEKKNYSV